MSGSMRKIGEYLGLLEDTGRYDDDGRRDLYEQTAVGQSSGRGARGPHQPRWPTWPSAAVPPWSPPEW